MDMSPRQMCLFFNWSKLWKGKQEMNYNGTVFKSEQATVLINKDQLWK